MNKVLSNNTKNKYEHKEEKITQCPKCGIGMSYVE